MTLRRGEPWLGAAILAAALAAAYLIVAPSSADFAAQVFRTELFQREGFTVWNDQWFAGHHIPGYSLLFPPLAALLGPRLVGVGAAVAAAVLFERLTHERFGEGARWGALAFAAATATNLFSGRLTFALGVTIGLGALLALQRRSLGLAFGLAALTALASPVAGLFLALAGLAWALAERRVAGMALAGAAFAAALTLAVAFPEAGVEPFAFSAFWPVIAFAVVTFALVPAEHRALRIGVVLYALACTAAFLIDTPMGGNATRLGTLFGPALLVCVLWRRRPVALALLAVPLLIWQWSPPVRDISVSAGDPATQAGYYAPVNRYLSGRLGIGSRVEIPLTRNHWETVYVARRFPLARGWERQLDIKYNGLFYKPALDAAAYRAWLDRSGVRYVAVPDAQLDYAGEPERRLIDTGVPYLQPVWRSAHWRVYAVRNPAPLVSGPARLQALGASSFTIRATRPGRVLVRVRYTPYWEVVAGAACISETPDGLVSLGVRSAGPVRVQTEFSPVALVRSPSRCSPGA